MLLNDPVPGRGPLFCGIILWLCSRPHPFWIRPAGSHGILRSQRVPCRVDVPLTNTEYDYRVFWRISNAILHTTSFISVLLEMRIMIWAGCGFQPSPVRQEDPNRTAFLVWTGFQRKTFHGNLFGRCRAKDSII